MVLAFLSANLSLSYLYLFLTFLRLNHPILLSNCRTQNYQSLTFIVLFHPLIVVCPFPNFLTNSVLSCHMLPLHLTNLSSQATLTIGLSRYILSHLSVSVGVVFLQSESTRFSYSRQKSHSRPPTLLLQHLCLLPTGRLQTTFPFSLNSLSTAFHCLLQVITRSAVFTQ